MTGYRLLSIIKSVAYNLFDTDPYLQSGGDMVRLGGLDYSNKPKNKSLSSIHLKTIKATNNLKNLINN